MKFPTDKTLQTKRNYPNKDKNHKKIMEQIFLLFLIIYVCICLPYFFNQLKVALKIARCKS